MKTRFISVLILFASAGTVMAAGEPGTGLKPDSVMQAAWNRFAEQTVALQRSLLAGKTVKKTEEVDRYGGEMGKAYSYREVTYTDADNGRLLGRLRTNAKRSDEVQSAEVYVYDEQGRVQRDYAFTYLPWARGAPIRTFANLHHYSDGLHAWRQFDASGRRIYEHCEGKVGGESVKLSISEDRIGGEQEGSEHYRVCFSGIARTAGVYLTPQ
jgi:hypothetical protein